ncbi:MAG: nucleotide exchange factor GrpE [Oceanicaulis sp.]
MTENNAKPDSETHPEDHAEDAVSGVGEEKQAGDAPLPEDERPELDAEQEGEHTPEEPGLDAQLAEAKDKLLRAYAEMENTKKRAQRDVKDARDYAVTGFARDMLDVADNLSRALSSIDDDAKNSAGPALQTLLEGVELTEKRLLNTLERHGVKKVEPAPGDPLDPNRHQAAAQVPADQPKGAIAHVMQPGYVIGERTLRAAMVVVSAGPAGGGSGGEKAPEKTPEPPKGGGVDVSA